MLGTVLLTSLLLTTGADSDRIGEARYQAALDRQCEETLGFTKGSEENMQCHLFYERLFRRLYPVSDSVSADVAEQVEKKIEKMNTTCEGYFKDGVISKSALWTCVQEQGKLERGVRRDYLHSPGRHRHKKY